MSDVACESGTQAIESLLCVLHRPSPNRSTIVQCSKASDRMERGQELQGSLTKAIKHCNRRLLSRAFQNMVALHRCIGASPLTLGMRHKSEPGMYQTTICHHTQGLSSQSCTIVAAKSPSVTPCTSLILQMRVQSFSAQFTPPPAT